MSNQPADSSPPLKPIPPGPPAPFGTATTLPLSGQPASQDRENGCTDIAGHEVLGELGRGGMGVVYKARHLELNRLVALKMILAGGHAGEDQLKRFRREAEAIARLQHPNIVQVYEIGEHESKPFFSLEYCPGGSLEDRLNSGPWASGRQIAELVETLARAMHDVHQQNIIHRDLKPANVLFSAADQPRITDFGLAKKLDDAGQTASGAIMGTPSYMAPEQAGGKSQDIGPAADIYALGAILYCMLTGRPPFQSANTMDTLFQVLQQDPVPPRRLNGSVDRDLETICLKCLQKEPAKRYANALDLAEDLGRFLREEPIRARPVGPVARSWRWCRRNPVVAGLLAVVLLSLLISFVNLQQSLARVETMAHRQQLLLAENLASRLDERIQSDLQAVELLSRTRSVQRLLMAPKEQQAQELPAVCYTLSTILKSNKDFSSAFILGPDGVALASTNPRHPGRSYAFRDYYQEAIKGKTYLSKILIGTSTKQAGMYYSAPVLSENGRVLGVAVIKLEARTIWQIADSLEVGETGSTYLVDEDGIIIAHRDRKLLYHSLGPLTEEELSRINPKNRFQSSEVPHLNIPELVALKSARSPGHLKYVHPEEGTRRVVSYAPLRERPWVLAVDVDAREFAGSRELLLWRYLGGMGFIGCLLAVVVLLFRGRLWWPSQFQPPANRAQQVTQNVPGKDLVEVY